ncbi:MAG: hypothetical protein HYZ00_09135, partial [Candidatus Hydrogenedentes bacterium]|nr:hypothetical protein [Candidatus Hydrogenedentota bacterium]
MKLDARILALFLGLLGGVALLGPAQEDAGSKERGAFGESTATADKDVRAPVEMPVPVPAASEKAMQYYRTGNWLWLLQLAWGLVVPAAFVFTGFSARLRTWAQSIGRWWYVVLCVYLVLFFLVNYLL